MRSSSLAYSASGFGVLRIAACTSFGIRKTPVTALIGQWPRVAALNSVHNNPGRAYAATPRTGVAPCHASLVWRLFRLLCRRIQGAGRWTGGGRVLLHLQRDLQQKRLRRDGATFLSPPKGILSMTHYLNIKVTFVLSAITNTRQSADHAVAPTTKDASRAGRRRTQRCRAVPFVTASPGRLQIPVTPLNPPRVRAPARKASGRRQGPRRARSRIRDFRAGPSP